MSTITILPTDEIKFVKTIYLEKVFFDHPYTAKIVYKRTPSETYKMDYSQATPFEQQIFYYAEKCYPHDLIDNIILTGIRQNYPNARVSTSLMLFDVEKQKIEKELAQYPQEVIQINIQPEADIDAIINSGKKQWRIFIKTLPVYLTNSKKTELFHNDCTLCYELDKEDELIRLEPALLNEVIAF